ncbi:hypothetical protein G653_00150 [Candidatus Liberibacter americanus PW_SP]|nr:hypothetical protein G653_00150 [Candidatus Liberibacter americanus PW_SP]
MIKGIKHSIMVSEGSVAIEFSILAFPYFFVVFAILEICICFSAQQLFDNASYTISRQIRTGELNKDNSSIRNIRSLFCREVRYLISCSSTEPQKVRDLYIDVKKINSLGDIPRDIPRLGTNVDAPINDVGFGFNPGDPGSYNVFRAFYHWPVFSNFMIKYLAAVKHPDKKTSDYLMASVVVFKNELFDK